MTACCRQSRRPWRRTRLSSRRQGFSSASPRGSPEATLRAEVAQTHVYMNICGHICTHSHEAGVFGVSKLSRPISICIWQRRKQKSVELSFFTRRWVLDLRTGAWMYRTASQNRHNFFLAVDSGILGRFRITLTFRIS